MSATKRMCSPPPCRGDAFTPRRDISIGSPRPNAAAEFDAQPARTDDPCGDVEIRVPRTSRPRDRPCAAIPPRFAKRSASLACPRCIRSSWRIRLCRGGPLSARIIDCR
jgi:hypothetical protein